MMLIMIMLSIMIIIIIIIYDSLVSQEPFKSNPYGPR